MGRTFSHADLEKCERENHSFYFLTDDCRMMVPATHVSDELAAHVFTYPCLGSYPGWVAWRVLDIRSGAVLVRGTENFYAHAPGSFARAARRALKAIQSRAHMMRVRPSRSF